MLQCFLIVKLYAYNHNFLPKTTVNWNQHLNEDLFILGGVLLVIIGIILSIVAVLAWGNRGFGNLIPESIMRITIPAVTMIAIGIQSLFSGFIMGIVKVHAK